MSFALALLAIPVSFPRSVALEGRLGGGADCETDVSAPGGAHVESGGALYANGGANRGE